MWQLADIYLAGVSKIRVSSVSIFPMDPSPLPLNAHTTIDSHLNFQIPTTSHCDDRQSLLPVNASQTHSNFPPPPHPPHTTQIKRTGFPRRHDCGRLLGDALHDGGHALGGLPGLPPHGGGGALRRQPLLHVQNVQRLKNATTPAADRQLANPPRPLENSSQRLWSS